MSCPGDAILMRWNQKLEKSKAWELPFPYKAIWTQLPRVRFPRDVKAGGCDPSDALSNHQTGHSVIPGYLPEEAKLLTLHGFSDLGIPHTVTEPVNPSSCFGIRPWGFITGCGSAEIVEEERVRNEVVLIFTLSLMVGCKTLSGDGISGGNSWTERVTTNPEEARIITTDIDHFWRAYDEATPRNDLRVYRDEYLRIGSAGLKEFARLKIGNVSNLVLKIWNHANYYASVRSSTRAIHSQDGRIRESFRKLKEIYPEALFPTVYFLIGSMNSGGIATEDEIMIGAELFSKTASSPLDELNPWEKSVVEPLEKIPQVVAHELIHFQQRFTKTPETLLERSLAEGGADFVSEMIAGDQINKMQHEYGERHEAALWREFRDGMYGKDLSHWLYNGGAVAAKGEPIERPADLGYYVGYKICQAFYEKSTDKKKAVKDMLEIQDFDRLLRESGYGAAVLTKR